MDYEAKMEQEAKKKKQGQLVGLIFMIVILLIAAYFLYQWQQKQGEKKFMDLAYQTLSSVQEIYKSDHSLGEVNEDRTYTFPDRSIVNFDERTLKGGTIIQYKNGQVAFALYNDKWCAIKSKSTSKIEVMEYQSENCIIK